MSVFLAKYGYSSAQFRVGESDDFAKFHNGSALHCPSNAASPRAVLPVQSQTGSSSSMRSDGKYCISAACSVTARAARPSRSNRMMRPPTPRDGDCVGGPRHTSAYGGTCQVRPPDSRPGPAMPRCRRPPIAPKRGCRIHARSQSRAPRTQWLSEDRVGKGATLRIVGDRDLEVSDLVASASGTLATTYASLHRCRPAIDRK